MSFLLPPARLPRVHMTSDASGSWGCGAWHGSGWFQLRWNHRSQPLTIAEKELIPIILGCAVWGRAWTSHLVECHCDNKVVVACIRTRSSKNRGIMHLLRRLMFIEAELGFAIEVTYINTKANSLADDLSCDNLALFLSKVPQSDKTPTAVPTRLLNLLLEQQADWISLIWCPQFEAIFRED